MKTLLIGINAKYIHPNLAIRLLKKNTTYPVTIREYTIKDSASKIVEDILRFDGDVIAFSCYIWNIERIKEILIQLKPRHKTIVLGGPEVSYNATFYLSNQLASFVIKNEGEEAFHQLLLYLDGKTELQNVPNLYHPMGFTFDQTVDLSTIQPAYDLLDDVSHKVIYIETSRGCPYQCGYCMASLEQTVRFFELEPIKDQLRMLIQKGAKTFKFLDRTFNIGRKRWMDLIDFIGSMAQEGFSFQFEITGDLLDDDQIDYIHQVVPKHLIRFEIGIQSTNLKSNLSVGRIQNNEKLFNNIRKIVSKDVIDLHLDLIAGLPYEDYVSFEKTFNDVIVLKPKELQLGFLKLLYGTALYNRASDYHYRFQSVAPYEIISNDFLNEQEIKEIHDVEEALEVYYNSGRFFRSIRFIIDQEESPFAFFNSLGKKMKRQSLEQTFQILDELIRMKPYYEEVHTLLIEDYLYLFKVKPKAWWSHRLDPKKRNAYLRLLSTQRRMDVPLQDLYKYSLLVELNRVFIVAIYRPEKRQIEKILKPDENSFIR